MGEFDDVLALQPGDDWDAWDAWAAGVETEHAGGVPSAVVLRLGDSWVEVDGELDPTVLAAFADLVVGAGTPMPDRQDVAAVHLGGPDVGAAVGTLDDLAPSLDGTALHLRGGLVEVGHGAMAAGLLVVGPDPLRHEVVGELRRRGAVVATADLVHVRSRTRTAAGTPFPALLREADGSARAVPLSDSGPVTTTSAVDHVVVLGSGPAGDRAEGAIRAGAAVRDARLGGTDGDSSSVVLAELSALAHWLPVGHDDVGAVVDQLLDELGPPPPGPTTPLDRALVEVSRCAAELDADPVAVGALVLFHDGPRGADTQPRPTVAELLVDGDVLDELIERLSTLGYAPLEVDEPEESAPSLPTRWMRAEAGGLVGVHGRLAAGPFEELVDHESIRARAVPFRIGGHWLRSLHPDDRFVLACLRAVEPTVAGSVELDVLAAAAPRSDAAMAATATAAQRWGASQAVARAMSTVERAGALPRGSSDRFVELVQGGAGGRRRGRRRGPRRRRR